MKIAQLIPQFYPHVGGAEVCIHNICSKLSEMGHEAVVITTSKAPENPPNLPYKIEYLWSKTCGMFRRLPWFIGNLYLDYELARLQKKYSFDLWQVTNGWPLGAFAIDFFKAHKIPCVLRCCGDDIQKYEQIQYGVRLNSNVDDVIKKKFPLFSSFVALTNSVKYEYNQLGIPDEKIRIIPNGVNTLKFSKLSEEKKNKIKANLALDPNYPLILTVGRYHPKKGFDIIPKVVELLSQRNIVLNWVVVGRNTKKILENYCKDRNDNIYPIENFSATFSNELFELPPKKLIELYCASDIFVFPTLLETFGMVLVEAMAAGLPIITTDAPGVRDVVIDGKQGLVAPVADEKALADKIETLLKNLSLRQKLSRTSLESSKKYDWNNVCHQYLDLYKKIV